MLRQTLLVAIANKVIHRARLTNVFKDLFPVVRDYVLTRCFGGTVDLDSDNIRNHLRRLEIQEAIAKYLARKIAELVIERREIEFEAKPLKLSSTKKFLWRRNLPTLICKRTIFNYVATYNNFERRFAEFIESWCERISQHTHSTWRFAPVNQSDFNLRKPKTLAEVTSPLRGNNSKLI